MTKIILNLLRTASITTFVALIASCGSGGPGGHNSPSPRNAAGNSGDPTTCDNEQGAIALADVLDAADTSSQWLPAWGTTRTGGEDQSGRTVRNITRVTASGDYIRLRFLNQNTDAPIKILAASVGIREGNQGATVKSGTTVAVTFNCGQTNVDIPANTESYYSDPIQIRVENQDDLAISLQIGAGSPSSEHGTAWSESWRSAADNTDHTFDEAGSAFSEMIDGNTSQAASTPSGGAPLLCNGCNTYAIRDVEVLTDEASGSWVFLGSSSLHGFNTTQNAYVRTTDLISARMDTEIGYGNKYTIVNRGIGGDTLRAAEATRFEKDVLDTRGVKAVLVWVTNDLSSQPSEEVIDTYFKVIARAHEAGIKVFCPTWVPGAQSSAGDPSTQERKRLNDWIATSENCDDWTDWGRKVTEPTDTTWDQKYFSEGIHSNDAGQKLWSDLTPINKWVFMAQPQF